MFLLVEVNANSETFVPLHSKRISNKPSSPDVALMIRSDLFYCLSSWLLVKVYIVSRMHCNKTAIPPNATFW